MCIYVLCVVACVNNTDLWFWNVVSGPWGWRSEAAPVISVGFLAWPWLVTGVTIWLLNVFHVRVLGISTSWWDWRAIFRGISFWAFFPMSWVSSPVTLIFSPRRHHRSQTVIVWGRYWILFSFFTSSRHWNFLETNKIYKLLQFKLDPFI